MFEKNDNIENVTYPSLNYVFVQQINNENSNSTHVSNKTKVLRLYINYRFRALKINPMN